MLLSIGSKVKKFAAIYYNVCYRNVVKNKRLQVRADVDAGQKVGLIDVA